MAVTPLCLMLATLSISPNRSQFFEYESVSLKCLSNSTGWTVKRTTEKTSGERCAFGWALPGESLCTIEDTVKTDTGEYWCESERGECSDKVRITVSGRPVILDSPAHPVAEGTNVTLRCSYKGEDDHKSTSDFTAKFYKDGVFIGTETTGTRTIQAVSKSDEGLYKCGHPFKGESLQSKLTVKVRPQDNIPLISPTPPPAPVIPWDRIICGVLLCILYNTILILSIYTYRKWARGRAEAKRNAAFLQE